MLRISVELLPYGMEFGQEQIGLIEIVNDGTGNERFGNYEITLYKQLGKNRDKRKSREVWRKGKLKGFRRELGPYVLLQWALNVVLPKS